MTVQHPLAPAATIDSGAIGLRGQCMTSMDATDAGDPTLADGSVVAPAAPSAPTATTSATPTETPADGPTAEPLAGYPEGDSLPIAEAVSLPAPPKRHAWRQDYARRLRITDFAVLVWVVYGTQLLWFGWGEAALAIRADSRLSDVSYWVFSGVLVIAWMIALALSDSRSDRVVGVGSQEYVRVVRSSFTLFGAIAIVAFLSHVDVARGYLLIAMPAGVAVLLLTRWLWRQWLVAQRVGGRYSARVLLVGSVSRSSARTLVWLRHIASLSARWWRTPLRSSRVRDAKNSLR